MSSFAPQPARSEPTQDLTGITVGRFVIHRLLGAGGMGQVYQAEDTRLKRPVAMKRMTPQLNTDEHYRRRFLKEAECASRLSHQYIAGIYDVFEERGEIFLVMEYVEGETLRQRLQRAISIDELVDIATQCATALVAAQAQGIVHRDIKPENIMLTPALQVKILDFGVARVLPGAGQTTTQGASFSTGGMAGTPAYMAPESLLEKVADCRSDIFSLGVTLYEGATGQHPFQSDTFLNTVQRVLHHTPPPVSLVNLKAPAELARIIAKTLCKDPAERYATSADLLVDLRALHRTQAFPTLAPPLGSPVDDGASRTAPLLTPASAVPPASEPSAGGNKVKLWVGLALAGALAVGFFLSWARLRLLLPAGTSATESQAPVGGEASPSAPRPEETSPSAVTPPVTPSPKQTGSLGESKSAISAASTPDAKKDKSARPRLNSQAAGAVESEAGRSRLAVGMGGLEVTTDVTGAQVLITNPDGKAPQQCTTPCRFDDLKPGRYTMEVTKEGYRTLHRIFDVQANKTVPENLRLEPQRAMLAITSEPAQAQVFVNGQLQPELTPTTVSLVPGAYTIAVQKASYGRYEGSVQLKDEDIRQVKFQLAPLPGTANGQPVGNAQPAANGQAASNGQVGTKGLVDIRTVPPAADILVEGASTGHRTPFRLELLTGQHTLTLYLKGYRAVQRIIVVQENQTVSLQEVLSQP